MAEENREQHEHPSPGIYPIQLVQIGNVYEVPAPLARISTCGGMTIEVLHEVVSTDPPQGRYVIVTPHPRQGSTTGRNLLSALVSLPGHYATKSWLTERLSRHKSEVDDDETWAGMVRVDNIVSVLRGLLCPPGITGENELRKALVRYVPNRFESGPGYQLAGNLLLWLDVDVLEATVKEACLIEQQGQDALPVWEHAYALATRGGYLLDERYSDWAESKRREVEGYQRQAVHALHRLYLAQQGDTAEEQVLLLLRSYWQTHTTDEDVLRPLLDLLGKRGCVQEAEEYYQRLCQELELEGLTPNSRTQSTIQNVRSEQPREHNSPHIRESIHPLNASSIVSPHKSGRLPSFSHNDTYNFSVEQSLNSTSRNPTTMPLSTPSFLQTDVDILTRLSTILNKPSFVSEREINYFDQQTRLYWRAREETTLPATTLYTYVIRHIDDITTLLARSHLPMLRSYLCEIICRTVLLAGILLYDMGQYAKARQQYLVSFQAAREANSLTLQAIVWGWMSFTWTYTKSYAEALDCVHYARSFAMQTTESIMQAWLGAIEAEIQAHLHNRDACLQAFSDMKHRREGSPSQDILYLFEFNPVLLLGYKGVCLQQFYQRQDPTTHRLLQEAKESLEQALASEAPIKRKLYYLTDLAGVYARQGEIEMACSYITQSLPLLMQVGSGSKTICKHLLQARTLLQPHEHTSYVQALDRQMAPLLIGRQTEEA